MSFARICEWVRLGVINRKPAGEILALVDAALDDIDEDDPCHQALVDIEEVLVAGKVPRNLLLELVLDSDPEDEPSEVALLERHYRLQSTDYRESEWRTAHYARLQRELAAPDPDRALDFAGELEEILSRIWSDCLEDYTRQQDPTAEAVVGHRLLRDGYRHWLQVFDLLEGDAPAPDVLAVAESAARLLVAVEHLEHDVASQARVLDF